MNSFAIRLYGEAFATAAGSGSVGVYKLKALSVKPIRKIKDGTQQVKQAFFVHQDLHPLIFKYLVCRIDLVVKAKVVHKSRTTSALYRNAYIVLRGFAFLYTEGRYSFLCFFCYLYHSVMRSDYVLSLTSARLLPSILRSKVSKGKLLIMLKSFFFELQR